MVNDSAVMSDMVLRLTALQMLDQWRKEIEAAIEQVQRPVVDLKFQKRWYLAQTKGMRWGGGDEAQEHRTGKARKRRDSDCRVRLGMAKG